MGPRTGERLFEELLIGGNPKPTHHPHITCTMGAIEDFLPLYKSLHHPDEVSPMVQRNDAAKVRDLLQSLVLRYRPSGDVVDWVHFKGREVG